MNDRFKFRVWDKQDGCYAYSNNSDVDVLYIETDGELTYGVYNNDYEDMNYIPESEIIIEQCTGLKDKNGKSIYEGDIVQMSYPYCSNNQYMIKWGDCCWELWLENGFVYVVYEKMSHSMEVIGNIHENADLIKVGGK